MLITKKTGIKFYFKNNCWDLAGLPGSVIKSYQTSKVYSDVVLACKNTLAQVSLSDKSFCVSV